MGRPRVKVVNPNEGWMGTEYYIDGKKIERVKSVDFRVAVDEIPQFTFESHGSGRTLTCPEILISTSHQKRFNKQL